MRSVTLAVKAAEIAARRKLIGTPEARLIERARNKGASRSESKRQLLATLDEEARRRGCQPAFPSWF